jgi:Zn ribbon nucleic-acid-binding protein
MKFPITMGFVCPMCNTYHTLTVELEQYLNYQSGELVQDAFPHMSPTNRERFVSGLCPDCQEEVFREF